MFVFIYRITSDKLLYSPDRDDAPIRHWPIIDRPIIGA